MCYDAIDAVGRMNPSLLSSSGEKFTLLALAKFYHKQNDRCSPSIDRIAQFTQQNTRTVKRHLAALEERGVIVRLKGKGRSTNVYVVPAFDGDNVVTPHPDEDDVVGTSCPEENSQRGHFVHVEVASDPPKQKETDSNPPIPSVYSPPSDLLGKPDLSKPRATAQATLALVMTARDARDVIDHRREINKPLTPRAALALAKQFAAVDDIPDAVEMMIANRWQGFRADWYEKSKRQNGVSNGHHQPQQQFKTFAQQTADEGRKYLDKIAANRAARGEC